jgi:L-seryl-tRNA(Ser) seleniumtransferase
MSVPDPRRLLPRMDAVLADPRLVAAGQRLGRARVRRAVADVLDDLRLGNGAEVPGADVAAEAALSALPSAPTSMRPVLNATGVVVHTNLGRAPLSAAAGAALAAAAGYVDVEYDLASGRRAPRGRGALAALLRTVPDATAAHVANNEAAGLLLAIATLATDSEVIISRGELIEIGDGFRLPELVEAAGARIHEVGTTNRTSLDDYAAAVGPNTGCILKVHPSNYRIEGFVRSVDMRDLARLGTPLVADIGSGVLVAEPALPAEPDVRSALRAGAALVVCSADKLLGGPQAGLIFGTDELVSRVRRHPLARALRVDKLTLAALEATLDGPPTPVQAALHADPARLRSRCERLAHEVVAAVSCEVVSADGMIGGGGAPGVALPGWALALPERFAALLRAGDLPIVARLERGRCIPESDTAIVRNAIRGLASKEAS